MRLKTPRAKQNGFVVIVVLCMIIMLSVLLFGFNYRSRSNLRSAEHFHKSQQALNCAKAGLNIAIAAIRDSNDIYIDNRHANLLTGENSFPVGQGTCSVTVSEESGKLNLNLLTRKEGSPNRAAIDHLLRLIDVLNRQHTNPRIGYGIVPAIIDWIDSDDDITYLPFIKQENLGAESDYYAALDPSYTCKNKPLDTAEELLLIKQITPEVFSRLSPFVTTKGRAKININSAPRPIIESLSENMDPALAQMIVNRRKIKPFESVPELLTVPGMTDAVYRSIQKTVSVRPADRYYLVTAQGNLDNCSTKLTALLKRNTETKNVDIVLYKEL